LKVCQNINVASATVGASQQLAGQSHLLDRGFGKATQPVESDVNLVNYRISAVQMTSEEWQAQYCTEEIKGEFSH
jgi:hypothetical protein